MNDFSVRPFAAGTLTGIRAFRVTDDGTLTGYAYQVPWSAGVNDARCYAGPLHAGWPLRTEPVANPDHRCASINCGCGFYAYFDDEPGYLWRTETLEGIVEGFGLCTVGTRGFRCEKARIVALIDNRPLPPPAPRVQDTVARLVSSLWRLTSADPQPEPHTVRVTAAVRERYPVPVFATREAAMRSFPLTPQRMEAA